MSTHDKPGLRTRAAEPEREAPEDLSPEERRSAVRRATFKAGEIILDDGRRIACIVRNISDSGCLIKVDNADTLPDLVAIRIDLDAPARSAEIVWRSTSLAGAMFVRKYS